MTSLFDLPFEDAAQPDAEAPPRTRRVLTVSQLAAAMRGRLEETFFEVLVEGEISNCRLWNTTGHLYFTLKDENAQLKAVMFRSSLRYLRFKPEDGLRVVARGRVTMYEPRGECQIACEHLEPHGLGALQLAVEQLKRRLDAEGLFARDRKRPLPLLPRKIGIATSLEGAAVRDIVRVLAHRHATLHLVIRPCRVQGDDAPGDIVRALRQLARDPQIDVLIVARGGGSFEDLQAFNHEAVARAIAASPVPVISGVGHEVDVTIADFVADVRAATPSNAAEIVVARYDDLIRRIDHLAHRANAAIRERVARGRRAVHVAAARRGLVTVRSRVAMRGRRIGELSYQLRRALDARLMASRRTLHDVRLRLETADQRRLLARLRARLVAADSDLAARARADAHRREVRLRGLAGRLENLSPLRVLARGYAMCWTEDRTQIVRDAAQVAPGDAVHVTLHKGELTCEVRERR